MISKQYRLKAILFKPGYVLHWSAVPLVLIVLNQTNRLLKGVFMYANFSCG